MAGKPGATPDRSPEADLRKALSSLASAEAKYVKAQDRTSADEVRATSDKVALLVAGNIATPPAPTK